MLMMIYVGKRFMDSYADCLILTDCSAVHVGTSCDHREQSRRDSDRRYFSVVRKPTAGALHNTQRVYYIVCEGDDALAQCTFEFVHGYIRTANLSLIATEVYTVTKTVESVFNIRRDVLIAKEVVS